MDQKFNWTVDVETDWGGRTQDVVGLDKGIPTILKAFKEFGVRALFFINSEIIERRAGVIQDILNEGHEIGCHGHFHICFKEPWRAHQNMMICQTLLKAFTNQSYFYWRAPKFSTVFFREPYSNSENHVGILKQAWFGGKIPEKPIFYLHPFDLVSSENRAPNLFCKLWYSKPRIAHETFRRLLHENMPDKRS